MKIEYDERKRLETLARRGLDFRDAWQIFSRVHVTIDDDRFAYGEIRHITVGLLSGRMMVLVWTPRGETIRVISLRKANDREQAYYAGRLGLGSG